ncbi:MAG TPA: TerB family tellurite resistance protein [Polyangiaceae bacterium]|nr:TerB family tellurite resistance protein [Polyangiaceae bacterium]
MQLTEAKLALLRARLQARGERRSITWAVAANAAEVAEAVRVVEEYGPICEAMYLVMSADNRVSNVERSVLRGALRVLSNDRVRSTHIESMVDVAARKVVEDGWEARLASVAERLHGDQARAELVYVLAHALAAADGAISPPEQRVLDAFAEALHIDGETAARLLATLERDAEADTNSGPGRDPG